MANDPVSVFLGIDYDENVETLSGYRGVTVCVGVNGTEERFNTGDPVADYRAAVKRCQGLAQKGHPVMSLSSLDHFVYDVPGYKYDENDYLVVDSVDRP